MNPFTDTSFNLQRHSFAIRALASLGLFAPLFAYGDTIQGDLDVTGNATVDGTLETGTGETYYHSGNLSTAGDEVKAALGLGVTESVIATGSNGSVAIGVGNTASGDSSTAWGSGNLANKVTSTVWGLGNTASGNSSTVWGEGNIANKLTSTAWGNLNTASGNTSTVWGENNAASGTFSTAWGKDNTASDNLSTAWGLGNIASDGYSTAWGVDNTASGHNSTTWGEGNTASQNHSTAWGDENTASGNVSTVWGKDNIASGSTSTAWGHDNEASNLYSTAWGVQNTASGNTSTAWGYFNTASGSHSTAWGWRTITESYLSTTFGRYNLGGVTFIDDSDDTNDGDTQWIAIDPLFEIGNGVHVNDRFNAFTILKDGRIALGTHSALPTTAVETVQIQGPILIQDYADSIDPLTQATAGAIRYDAAAEDFMAAVSVDANGNATWKSLTGSEDGRITDAQIQEWQNAFAWGDHATEGYLNAADINLDLGESVVIADAAGDLNLSGELTVGGETVLNTGNFETTLGLNTGDSIVTTDSNDSTAWGLGDAGGDQSTAWGLGQAYGDYSTSWGDTAVANGNYSTAWGSWGYANGDHSTIWGTFTVANGDYSTAFGMSTQANSYASVAFGEYNIRAPATVVGQLDDDINGETDDGDKVWIDSDALLEVGNSTNHANRSNALTILKDGRLALGTHSVLPTTAVETVQIQGPILIQDYAAGVDPTTSATAGAIRYDTTTNDFAGYDGTSWKSLTNDESLPFLVSANNLSWGEASIVLGDYSTAWGLQSKASGDLSTAWGVGTRATGDSSTAWGEEATASGHFSTAWGDISSAIGDYSTTWGGGVARGRHSTAWGGGDARGRHSTAWGGSNAIGDYSTAFGNNTDANSYASVAFGQYNVGVAATVVGNLDDEINNETDDGDKVWIDSDSLLEVGNGIDNPNRSNALTILKDGRIALGTHSILPTTTVETVQVQGPVLLGDYADGVDPDTQATAGAIRYDGDFEGYVADDGSGSPGWKSLTAEAAGGSFDETFSLSANELTLTYAPGKSVTQDLSSIVSSAASTLVDDNDNTVLSVDSNGDLALGAGSGIKLSDSTTISSASDLQAVVLDPDNGAQLIALDDSGDLVIAYSETDAAGAVEHGSMLRQGDTEGRGTFEWTGHVSTSSTSSSKSFYVYISEETQGLWGYFDVTLTMTDWSSQLGYGTGALVKRYNVGYRHGNEPNLYYEFLTNTSQVISANGGTAVKAILGDLEKDPVSGDLRILVQLKGGHRSNVMVHVAGLHSASNSFDGFPYLTTLGPSSDVLLPDNAVEMDKLEVATSVRLPNGSATEPALTFSNDPDSGLFLPEDSHVALVTEGEARLLIDSEGHVGINNENPSVALDVNGDANVDGLLSVSRVDGFNAKEALFEGSVDGSSGSISLRNATIWNGRFIAALEGDNQSDSRASLVLSGTSLDTLDVRDVNSGAITLTAKLHDGDPVDGSMSKLVNRRLMVVKNYQDTMLSLEADGRMGLGVDEPTERLEVDGAIKFGNASSETPATGTIRYDSGRDAFEAYVADADGLGNSGWLSLTYGADADADPVNEMNQSLTLNGTLLELTDGNGTLSADLKDLVPDSATSLASPDATVGNAVEVTLEGTVLVEAPVDKVALQVVGDVKIEGDLEIAGLTRKGDVFMGQFGRSGDDYQVPTAP